MSETTIKGEGVLCIAPQIYRAYAAEFKEMARISENDQQRVLYLKMMHTWLDAASRFELSEPYYSSLQNPAA